jgi:hypothetical protein
VDGESQRQRKNGNEKSGLAASFCRGHKFEIQTTLNVRRSSARKKAIIHGWARIKTVSENDNGNFFRNPCLSLLIRG